MLLPRYPPKHWKINSLWYLVTRHIFTYLPLSVNIIHKYMDDGWAVPIYRAQPLWVGTEHKNREPYFSICLNLIQSRYSLVDMTRKYLWNTNRPQPPPNSKGYGFLYIFNRFSMKTAIFGQFDHFRWGCFWPKWSKGTSTDQDLSFEPIIKSLWPSVQKF